eukprot:GHVP01067091.1.p1 GENE.GHVP01067091.1~~GHVP01067091.1.p1  ORF type:complete len:577 (+),score=134.78 GHVP01067091.1:28-1731(+)
MSKIEKTAPAEVSDKKRKLVSSGGKDSEFAHKKRQKLIKEMNKLAQSVCIAEGDKDRTEASKELLKYISALKYRASHDSKDSLLMKAQNPQISRALQLLIRRGTTAQKNYIIDALSEKFSELIQVPYASKLALSMYRHGTEVQRSTMVSHLKLGKFFYTKAGAEIFDLIYEKANSQKKIEIVNRIALPKFFRVKYSTLISKSIPEIYEEISDSSDKDFLRDHLESSIDKCVNKELLHTQICHALLSQLMDTVKEDSKSAFLESLMNKIAEGSHALLPTTHGTKAKKDGALALCRLIGFATTSQKKRLAKTLKAAVVEHSQDPKMYFFIMRLLDVTDDTKLLNESILRPICEDFDKALDNQKSYKILASVTSRTTEKRDVLLDSFEKSVMNFECAPCKKSRETRRKELVPTICTKIAQKATNVEEMANLLANRRLRPLLSECFLDMEAEFHNLFVEMIKTQMEKLSPNEEIVVFDDPLTSKVVVGVLGEDASKDRKFVDKVGELVLNLSDTKLLLLLQRRSIFIVVETLNEAIKKRILKAAKDFIGIENSSDSPFTAAGKKALKRKMQ